MAGLSRTTFSLLEVLTSSDLGAAFRLAGRDVLEIARYLTGDRPVILGGLQPAASTTGVQIAPGALLEPYAGGVAVPRADESPTILGLLRAQALVPVPALGVATWYLVEARAAELDTQGSRDVLDQVARTTEPQTQLVQRETSLTLRARVGTATALPALAAGWQPVAAVLRQTSGPVADADVYDLRTTVADLEPAPPSEQFQRHDYAVQNLLSGTATLQFDVALTDRFGHRLYAKTPSVLFSTLFEAGFTPLTNQWSYIYLATIGDVAPETATGRGVLVVSATPPSAQGGRVPSAPIALPQPWGGLGTVNATCIGCLRTNDFSFSGAYLAHQSCSDGRYELGDGDGPRITTTTRPAAFVAATGGAFLPVNARSAILRVQYSDTSGGSPSVVSSDPAFPTAKGATPLGASSGDFSPLWVLGTDISALSLLGTALWTYVRVQSVRL